MDPAFILEMVMGAKDLANSARIEVREIGDQRKVQRIQIIIEALRRIYFSPRGVITLPNSLADGHTPTVEQISLILPEFNDVGFRVDRFIDRLDPPNGHREGDLSLKAERVLREIAYGKTGVRQRVQELLNESLTLGEPVTRKDARELLDAIIQLNTAIEDAEEALMLALIRR